MKKILLTSIFILSILLLSNNIVSGQGVPQGLKYMAIARDNDHNILPVFNMTVIIGIVSDEAGENIIWEETHDVTTNETGLFDLVVGEGTTTGRGSADSFDKIDWVSKALYIQTTLNVKGDIIPMGTAQLFSVPYSLVSETTLKDLDNPFMIVGETIVFIKKVDILSQTPVDDPEPLFQVKRNDGKVMFAVYNQGIRFNVPLDDIDPEKGAKGGFSIGGFSGSKEDITQDLFVLNKDSARIYIDQTPDLIKGAKGGFSVGGFNYTGGKEELPIQEYLSITPQDARINVGGGAKGAKGGFSVGGYGSKEGESVNFMNITPENYFIGHESGIGIQETGLYNSTFGYQAGKDLTTGSYNTFLGYNAGISNQGGESNVFIGYDSGKDNITGKFNVMIGKNAGVNASGDNNIFIGQEAGKMTAGDDNIFIGVYAGSNLTSGIHNLFIGSSAGLNHTTQEYNVMLGTSAGAHLTESYTWQSSFNTFMGINSGYKIATGKENVFLGTNSGYWIENGSGNTIVGIDAGRSGNEHTLGYVANNNTIMGDKAGYNILDGDNNTIIGYHAGHDLTSGTGNVFIGYQAGYRETGSNKLYISNYTAMSPNPVNPPLIYGDFSLDRIGLGTMSPAYKLDIVGDVNISSGSTYRINGTPIVASQWSTVTNGIQYNSGVGINTAPDASIKLKVSGNADISGNITAASLTVYDNINTDGELHGNVVGDVVGNVSGSAGNIGGVSMGKINKTGSGTILSVFGMNLTWNSSTYVFSINNGSSADTWYWYTIQSKGEAPSGNAMRIDHGFTEDIFTAKDGSGCEIHFGDAEGTGGYCSLWIQVVGDVLTGHYIKNQ